MSYMKEGSHHAQEFVTIRIYFLTCFFLAVTIFYNSRLYTTTAFPALLARNAEMVCMNQVTYLHRITYVGEHSFRDDPTVQQLYGEIIRDVNSEDPDEILTGFLLCYDGFFVHILEVSSWL